MPKIKEKETRTKDKKKKSKKAGWHELVEKKEEFKNIVSILNRFYNLHPTKNHPSLAHKFREDIVRAEAENLRVFLKKFGSYEYLIVVEISSGSGKRMDSWIHIDGISQERVLMKEKGNLKHPVFKIKSISDLFQSHTKEVEEGFQLNVQDIAL